MKYDVFISSKSNDYHFAKEIYTFLVQNGLSVFLASAELQKIGEAQYAEAIDEALDESHHMIVVATSLSHINSKWVKYEWSTFSNDLKSNYKSGNLLTILDHSIRLKELPASLRHQQSFLLTDYKNEIVSFLPKEESTVILQDNAKNAEVHIDLDAECQVFVFGEYKADLIRGKNVMYFLKTGEHELTFVSKQFPNIKKQILVVIPTLNYSTRINVSFEKEIKKEEQRILLNEKKEKAVSTVKSFAESVRGRFVTLIKRIREFRFTQRTRRIAIIAASSLVVLVVLIIVISNIAENIKEKTRLEWLKWHPVIAEEQYLLAMRYLEGDSVVEQNIDSALSYLSKASDQDYSQANYVLGDIYHNGKYGVPVNDSISLFYLNKAVEQENPMSYALIGDMYANGYGVSKDANKAFKYYKAGVAKGDTAALWRVTKIYIDGNRNNCIKIYYSEGDWDRVTETYKKLTSNTPKEKYRETQQRNSYNTNGGSNKSSSFNDIDRYYNNSYEREVLLLIEKGLDYQDLFYPEMLKQTIITNLRLLSKKRHHGAISAIVTRDISKKEKARWLSLADSIGVGIPQSIAVKVWKDYADSLSKTKNDSEAFVCYNKAFACDSTNKEVNYRLGIGYFIGRGVNQDMKKAVNHFQRSKGYSYSSMLYLAYCHYCGQGVDSDLDSAKAYYLGYWKHKFGPKCFRNNELDTLIMLGDFCYYVSSKNDKDKARDYYMASAKKNNRIAEYMLGILYKDTNDTDTAQKWFKKSAGEGKRFAPSQYEIGEYYYNKQYYKTATNYYKSAGNCYYRAAEKLYNIYSSDYLGKDSPIKGQNVSKSDQSANVWYDKYVELYNL